MSNLLSMMYTGVSGANAAQVGIDITGHNLANVNNPNYSRQRANLAAVTTSREMNGAFGRGVKVTEIIRVYDELIAKTLRTETSSLSYWEASEETLSEIGIYFNEYEDGSGIGSAIRDYFDSWSQLATTPTDNSSQGQINRTNVINTAETLATQIKEDYLMFDDMRAKLDTKIDGIVSHINDLSKSMAEINARIVATEALGQHANDLRDERDAIANELATLGGVNVVERANGEYAVYLAGSPLVDGANSYPLSVTPNKENSDHLDITWSTGESYSEVVVLTERIAGGSLQGYIEMRDQVIPNYQKQLDDLAHTIIYETNKLHAAGQGLERYTQLTSKNNVINPEYLLNSKVGNLPFEVKEGTFQINVYETVVGADGKKTDTVVGTYSVSVNPDEDNLYGVAEKISLSDGNASDGMIQATVNNDGTLKITVKAGYTFAFGEDTSDFLVAAGLNSFFDGSGAKDMAVETAIIENPNYIAASANGVEGNNEVATNIAKLLNNDIASINSVTIDEFYGYFTGSLAATQQQTKIFLATKEMTVEEFSEKLEQVKGVSMEEEQSNLAMLQRVFEANSRYITVIDEMLNMVINNLGLVGR